MRVICRRRRKPRQLVFFDYIVSRHSAYGVKHSRESPRSVAPQRTVEAYRIIIRVCACLKFFYELINVTFRAVKSALNTVSVRFVYVIRRVIVKPLHVIAERRNRTTFAAKVYIGFYAEPFNLLFALFGNRIEMRQTVNYSVFYSFPVGRCKSAEIAHVLYAAYIHRSDVRRRGKRVNV